MAGNPEDDKDHQPPYSGGVPSPERFGFIPIYTASAEQMPLTDEALQAISQRLGRPVQYVDDNGYDHEITAGALHPSENRFAWVEYKCKELKGGHVDVEFRLKAQADGQQKIDWVIETYNPYFGCVIQYVSWHGESVVVVYREKHHTYVCSLSLGGAKKRAQIADEWLLSNDEITYTSRTANQVDRLRLPDLKALDSIPSAEARQLGVLPEGYEDANELNMRIAAQRMARKPKGFWGGLKRVLRWPSK